MTLTDTLTDVGFGVGWKAIQYLPEPMVHRAFRAFADRTYRGNGQGVRQLRANLARVIPQARQGELDEVTREGVRRYMRYWSEAFLLPSWSPQRLRDEFVLDEGIDRLDAAVAAGSGAVMVASHSGNWDLAAAWACDRYGGLTTVAERLRPEGLFDKFVAYRESLGMEVLAHGDEGTLATLAQRLREGKLVCLVADRDLSGSGVHVDFFGETASMPAGPAMLSLLTGAPTMPVILWHDADRLRGRVDEALPMPVDLDRQGAVTELTQRMADAFAAGIGAHPEDWHMMQRLWLSDVPAREPS